VQASVHEYGNDIEFSPVATVWSHVLEFGERVIDSHCHLADDAFIPDLDAVIQRAKSAGLSGALCIVDATIPQEAARVRQVRDIWPEVGCAVGVHPHHAGKFTDRSDEVELVVSELLEANCGIRAIGEIGLDYHYDFSPRDLQQEVFRRQVSLARDCSLPIIIHTREADEDTIRILHDEGHGEVRGVFHCFAGDAGFARKALDLGFHISFSGIVTFRRAENVREAAQLVPADRLLAETDAPYLAPVPYRGKRNEPSWVARVIEVLAEVRGQSVNDVAEATTGTFWALFGRADEFSKGLLR
jgi:TatD DNase family protein